MPQTAQQRLYEARRCCAHRILVVRLACRTHTHSIPVCQGRMPCQKLHPHKAHMPQIMHVCEQKACSRTSNEGLAVQSCSFRPAHLKGLPQQLWPQRKQTASSQPRRQSAQRCIAPLAMCAWPSSRL